MLFYGFAGRTSKGNVDAIAKISNGGTEKIRFREGGADDDGIIVGHALGVVVLGRFVRLILTAIQHDTAKKADAEGIIGVALILSLKTNGKRSRGLCHTA